MRPPFSNILLVDDDNLISIPYRGKTMRDGDRGTVFSQRFQTLLNVAFTFIIKCAGGFVENKDGRIL